MSQKYIKIKSYSGNGNHGLHVSSNGNIAHQHDFDGLRNNSAGNNKSSLAQHRQEQVRVPTRSGYFHGEPGKQREILNLC